MFGCERMEKLMWDPTRTCTQTISWTEVKGKMTFDTLQEEKLRLFVMWSALISEHRRTRCWIHYLADTHMCVAFTHASPAVCLCSDPVALKPIRVSEEPEPLPLLQSAAKSDLSAAQRATLMINNVTLSAGGKTKAELQWNTNSQHRVVGFAGVSGHTGGVANQPPERVNTLKHLSIHIRGHIILQTTLCKFLNRQSPRGNNRAVAILWHKTHLTRVENWHLVPLSCAAVCGLVHISAKRIREKRMNRGWLQAHSHSAKGAGKIFLLFRASRSKNKITKWRDVDWFRPTTGSSSGRVQRKQSEWTAVTPYTVASRLAVSQSYSGMVTY